jgi:hypothetical protein
MLIEVETRILLIHLRANKTFYFFVSLPYFEGGQNSKA